MVGFHGLFLSCNEPINETHWCGVCDKCAFVYLLLSAFLSQLEVWAIFHGRDMLSDDRMVGTFLSLIGAGAGAGGAIEGVSSAGNGNDSGSHNSGSGGNSNGSGNSNGAVSVAAGVASMSKPFECVGTSGETKAAVELTLGLMMTAMLKSSSSSSCLQANEIPNSNGNNPNSNGNGNGNGVPLLLQPSQNTESAKSILITDLPHPPHQHDYQAGGLGLKETHPESDTHPDTSTDNNCHDSYPCHPDTDQQSSSVSCSDQLNLSFSAPAPPPAPVPVVLEALCRHMDLSTRHLPVYAGLPLERRFAAMLNKWIEPTLDADATAADEMDTYPADERNADCTP